MTSDEKRGAVALDMNFRDPGYLRWLDGLYEAEEVLIKREQAAGSDAAHPHYACWEHYVEILEKATAETYGGALHANVAQRLDAYLKVMRLLR